MSRNMRFPPRFPRPADGIRAQATRVPDSWWGRKWNEAVERMNLCGRTGRGRRYAADGQVVELVLNGSRVAAKVMGVRSEAYAVALDFRRPEGEARERIIAAIRKEPITVARILAGDLPLEVEEIFRAEGYDLLPGGKLEGERKYDMVSSCSCPDYANPCKHTAAVLTLVGEEIARRPLTLLGLRGIEERELCDED